MVSLVVKVNVREQMAEQSSNLDAPQWYRVAAWCWANATSDGHARATAGEIERACGLANRQEASRAVSQARARGVLDECSNLRCLVLPGHRVAPCPAQHRGEW